MGGKWQRDETLAALALYLILPGRFIDDTGPDIQQLAHAIGRTPSAVAMKAWNLSAYDENRIRRGKKGMTHGSKLDAQIWKEYSADPEKMIDEAVVCLNRLLEGSEGKLSEDLSYAVVDLPPEGAEREVIARQRVRQNYFRNSLLVNYNHACCITGMKNDQLLVASHIKPWKDSDPKTERTTPKNGLLLNALHDRAFDKGLITIGKDYRIYVSSRISEGGVYDQWFRQFEGSRITLPLNSPPSPEFIEYHNDVVFQP